MKIKDYFRLAIAIAVSELAGIIGAIFTMPAIPTWYQTLTQPIVSPPAWIFAPVWTTLFALMGGAAFLIWRPGQKNKNTKIALGLFGGQLLLNILWSFLFFGQHNPGAALIEIIILWLAILATIIAFFKISRAAGWLLVPYLLWVSFASYLNLAIWTLN